MCIIYKAAVAVDDSDGAKEREMDRSSLSESAEGFWLRAWRYLSAIDEAMSASGVASVNEIEVLDRRLTRLEEQVLDLSHGGPHAVTDSSKAIR
jgi:hypothetical protein